MDLTPLTKETVNDYVRSSPLANTLFANCETLKSEPITEGNVNLLFRVYADESQNGKSVLVKQALPYAWRYPDFKMPLDRSRIEYSVLSIEAQYCPEHVPQVYLYDEEQHIMVLEYFDQHFVLREGLMEGTRFPRLAKHMGVFMARTLFYTSDLYLSSADKKAMVPEYINPVLCKIQEDLVFTEPFIDHPNNKWTGLLNPTVAAIHTNDQLRCEIFALKERYMSHAQALIHNDLHTGSIMVNQSETKIIDPEFAFFGPIGHDVGTYLGNLALGYAAQEFHAKDETERASYRQWIAETIRETWKLFEAEFIKLWEDQGNDGWPSPAFKKSYMRQLLQDSAGFGATEMIRRLIGMAHVHDFWTIPDDVVRARAESIGLDIALGWVMERHTLETIDQLLEMVTAAKPHRSLS